MSLTLVLQIIHTTWTKASRGGSNATARNAVPLALPIQSTPACFAVEMMPFGEENNFVAPLHPSFGAKELSNPLVYDWKSLGLKWNGMDLIASFKWSASGAGAPRMVMNSGTKSHGDRRFQRDLLVPLDNWVRVRWTGRYSDFDTGQWWYEHTVANIALLSSTVKPRLFIETAPHDEFHRLAILR